MIDIKVIATGSRGNCYQVSDGRTTILLDAGIGIDKIKKDVKIGQLSGVLITHQHRDHCKAVPKLIASGVRVYAIHEVFDSFDIHANPFARIVLPMVSHDGSIKSWFRIGSFHCVPFDLKHDVPNVGWYIISKYTGESLLYFTDTRYVTYRFPGINYMLAECNYVDDILIDRLNAGEIDRSLAFRIRNSHMGLDQLIKFLSANDISDLKQVHVIHLSDGNSDENIIKDTVMKKTGAEVYIA